MTRIFLSLTFAVHLVVSGAAQPGPDDADAQLDERVRTFARQVRCLVCQNETLADSRAELAMDLKREIREQMKAGRSDEEIVAFLTDRYGDFVLYRPPLKPSTYLLWFGPSVLLGSGLFALYRELRAWRTVPDGRELSAAERTRVRQILQTQQEQGRERRWSSGRSADC